MKTMRYWQYRMALAIGAILLARAALQEVRTETEP